MADDRSRVRVEVDGRVLVLTSLEKVMFPGTGMTKAEVIAYYREVAPAILAQLHDRPATRLRFPHGVSGESFFEKNLPSGAPSWMRRVTLVSPHSRRADELVTYPLVDDVPGLVWLGQVGALELHVPQWRVAQDGTTEEAETAERRRLDADRLVVDLDPGAPAGLHECAKVALLVRDVLVDAGLDDVVPVTSGSKGLQLYAFLPALTPSEQTREMAKTIADHLQSEHPDLVLSSMARQARGGKIFLDWSQNVAAKTTICPYSLRGKRDSPFAAAPRTWEEIEKGAEDPIALEQLTPREVISRLDSLGDLLGGR
ncbi:non-homologous end-joining DNA ligase [Mobilicoccus pelagius]|uniref:ATP-dependent DNA ligase LigD n=1 Tax=Mobilicoccus pelagius NBRC 104925 TaxID=1089455 RepID=H5US72_9MICO|nr:non-homologous end-joining DNA ligase [Mobilicoccus pelagius]GAB48580.1 ATP-dependent DNA ligase LigD [Mobilicoccus pelagius NBRC 104925]